MPRSFSTGSTLLFSAINILHVSGTLSRYGTKPATLYLPSYVSKRLLGTLPQPLPLLSKPSYLDLEYHELLKACESVKVEVAEGMAIAVEKKTDFKPTLTFGSNFELAE